MSSCKYFVDYDDIASPSYQLPPVFNYASDNFCATGWKTNEKKLLAKAVNNNLQRSKDGSIEWSEIANHFHNPKRSPMECLIQYRNVQDPSLNHNPWTRSEEAVLIKLCVKHDERNWPQIADELGTNRSPIECLKHYQRSLNKTIIKSDDWTPEEDECLIRAAEIHGYHWQHVADAISGRTSAQCQRRHRKIVPGLEAGPWTDLQERRLVLAIRALRPLQSVSTTETSDKSYPRRMWTDVAALVPGKDQEKCREKWVNVLDPTVDRSEFRPEEDDIILSEMSRQRRESGADSDAISWTKVAALLPGRVDCQVWARWRQLQDRESVSKYRTESRKRKRIVPAVLGRKGCPAGKVGVDDFDLVLRAPLAIGDDEDAEGHDAQDHSPRDIYSDENKGDDYDLGHNQS